MADLETILTYLTLISVPIGVFYHIMTLNNTRKNQQVQLETRQAQLFMQIYQEMSSVENFRIMSDLGGMEWDDYDDFMRKYSGETNREAFAKRYSHQYKFDGIGILVKTGLIDLERVYDLMYDIIVWHWDKYGDINIKHREVFDNPDFMAGYEYLVYELKKMRVKKGFSADRPEILGRYVAQNRPDA